jgi:tRNA (uracil-5-)-methyltransferase TRM9
MNDGGTEEEDKTALNLEQESVHRVYDIIAGHFSDTRYKVQSHFKNSNTLQPWPLIEKFLKELPPGSIGLDVGCGNGKYLGVNPNIYVIGSDRLPLDI